MPRRELTTFEEVLEEMAENVNDLEPFLSVGHASTAFCLLYKCWTLRLTVPQIEQLVDYRNNSYVIPLPSHSLCLMSDVHLNERCVRAIGFLYLRYVCKPDRMWDWFGAYLLDEEAVRLTRRAGTPMYVRTSSSRPCPLE